MLKIVFFFVNNLLCTFRFFECDKMVEFDQIPFHKLDFDLHDCCTLKLKHNFPVWKQNPVAQSVSCFQVTMIEPQC